MHVTYRMSFHANETETTYKTYSMVIETDTTIALNELNGLLHEYESSTMCQEDITRDIAQIYKRRRGWIKVTTKGDHPGGIEIVCVIELENAGQ